MAKYADYVKSDSIESEINEAAQASAQREQEIPAQFRGKSFEDVVESYKQLERMNSQQANELGDLRKTNSMLLERSLTSTVEPEGESNVAPEPVTMDDLYEDPNASINRVVGESDVARRLEELERQQAQSAQERQFKEFEEKYPNYQEQAKSEQMRNWIQESDYRKRMAAASDQGDLQAAEDLFSMYNDLLGNTQEQDRSRQREQDLNAATLESGMTTMHPTVETFSRSNLELARRKAKMGDPEAEAYMKANGPAIRLAYEERRIVD